MIAHFGSCSAVLARHWLDYTVRWAALGATNELGVIWRRRAVFAAIGWDCRYFRSGHPNQAPCPWEKSQAFSLFDWWLQLISYFCVIHRRSCWLSRLEKSTGWLTLLILCFRFRYHSAECGSLSRAVDSMLFQYYYHVIRWLYANFWVLFESLSISKFGETD